MATACISRTVSVSEVPLLRVCARVLVIKVCVLALEVEMCFIYGTNVFSKTAKFLTEYVNVKDATTPTVCLMKDAFALLAAESPPESPMSGKDMERAMMYRLLTHSKKFAKIQKDFRLTPCLVCGEKAKSVCSRCDSAWYCGEDCQKKHWKSGHEKGCKKTNKD
jgi:hypothetical protein